MTSERMKITGASLTLHYSASELEPNLWTMAVSHLSFLFAETGAELLDQACAKAIELGAAAMIGPMEGDTWHAYRLISESDGRPAFLMEPTSGPNDAKAFELAGFSTIGRYFSAAVALETKELTPPRDDGLQVQTWDGSDPETLFTQVYDLSSKALVNNPYYRPITREDFLGMYMPIVPMLKHELVLFARDNAGELAGFLFGIPNYAEGPKPQSVILKTYASLRKGAGHALSYHFHRNARALGYAQAIHALIHESNLSGERSGMEGAEVFRRYALMGKRLDG